MKNVNSIRNEIANSIRAVRTCCFGRKCFRDCVKRMAATAPLRRAVRRCGGAVVAAALAMWALCAHGAAVCNWDGDGYICSGSGASVQVNGGGSGGGSDTPPVVTNIIGVCTNCVNMSPDFIRQWKQEMHLAFAEPISFYDYMLAPLRDVKTSIDNLFEEYPLSHAPGYPGFPSTPESTNFLASIGFPSGPFANTAARLASDAVSGYGSPWTASVGARLRLAAYNSAVDMYNYCCSQFDTSTRMVINEAIEQIPAMKRQLQTLELSVDQLSEEQCQPEWGDGGSSGGGSGGDSGSGSSTNGNWCTYEQGDAIQQLLIDIGKWQKSTLLAASNLLLRVEGIEETVKSALLSSYTHIPSEQELGTTWQQLYLQGYNPNFHEYAATNIVARIELLLAGMSGVLTNSDDYADAEALASEQDENIDTIKDTFDSLADGFETSVKSSEESTRSIGQALVRLYQQFRDWTGAPFSTEQVISSYSVEMSSTSGPLDVPGFAMRQEDVAWANVVRVVIRSCMSVIYFFLSIGIFVKFQIVFFQWCWKYVKWAIELMQGLFL